MENPLKLKRIHHVEFYVGNARQASFYYRNAFGFSQVAYSGLETGNRQFTSYLLRQGKADILLTTPLRPEQPCQRAYPPPRRRRARHRLAGRGRRSGLRTKPSSAAPKPAEQPHDLVDEHGKIRRAAVHTYGDTIHSLISYKDYSGPFLPGFVSSHVPGEEVGILRIDHMVGNVELGKMNHWAEYYSRVFGFHRFISFDDKDISTEYSALMSIVMSDDSYSVKFPINEPAAGKRKSQIDEYLRSLLRSRRAAHRPANQGRHRAPWRNCAPRALSFCAFPTPITTPAVARGPDTGRPRRHSRSRNPGRLR